MMKLHVFISICFLLAGKLVSPQTYTMPVTGTQTDTVCGGIFYDSGGPAANYANNENGIIIFYPAVPGQFVMLAFSSINLSDAGERLRIFRGTDTTTVPLFSLAGPANSAGCGATVTSNTAGGCLTVHFRSNSAMVASGWRALLYCNPVISTTIPGSNCLNPFAIPSIPFTHADQCTECMLNDFQSQGGICNTSYAGEDRVYRYTAIATESVCITMSNTTANTRLAIYNGCPGSGGVCLTPTPMVGNDSIQFTFPAAGTYYIIIDATSGFSCYDLNIISCIVGMEDQENTTDEVSIFPNPAVAELNLESSKLKIKSIEIYDMVGQHLSSQTLALDNYKLTIDVSGLPDGIYFITVSGENKNLVTKKFVKM